MKTFGHSNGSILEPGEVNLGFFLPRTRSCPPATALVVGWDTPPCPSGTDGSLCLRASEPSSVETTQESLCNKLILMLYYANDKNEQNQRFFPILTLWPVTVFPLPSQMTPLRLDRQELNEQPNLLRKGNDLIGKCMMDMLYPSTSLNTDDWT